MVLLGDMPDITPSADRPPDRGLRARLGLCCGHGQAAAVIRSLGPGGFFGELMSLTGDKGAREVMQAHTGQVVEIEAGDDAPLADIDTCRGACRLSRLGFAHPPAQGWRRPPIPPANSDRVSGSGTSVTVSSVVGGFSPSGPPWGPSSVFGLSSSPKFGSTNSEGGLPDVSDVRIVEVVSVSQDLVSSPSCPELPD
jgi:hypothetical protein